ncbi:hypothetical protein ACWGNF_34410 [Streptomyces sp. NPDC055808]|uniref:hypothetical protein n=1 Tax=Streptomyces sp. NPDC001828 TaxID=3364615 RepID=UPI00369F3C20
MTTKLVSAAALPAVETQPVLAAVPAGRRRGLAARAAAQHAGRAPAALRRVTLTVDTVPSASAFQSAL